MEERQSHELLILASAIDRRTVDMPARIMWHELIGDLDFEAAKSALKEHRLTAPGVYLEPGHLVKILQQRRRSAAQVTAPAVMCDLHDGYPLDRAGRCDQCTRYPEDRAVGLRPPTRHLGELTLTVGRAIPEEA